MADRPEVKIDEVFLVEWFDFGWSELISYLTKQANFDAWLERAGRKEVPSEP